MLHPIATDLNPVHFFKKNSNPTSREYILCVKCEVLVLFYCMGFVVDHCNRNPQVQNGHDDKPNEDWRKKERKGKDDILTKQSTLELLLTLCVSCGDDGGEDPC